jgi:hypothetical protein
MSGYNYKKSSILQFRGGRGMKVKDGDVLICTSKDCTVELKVIHSCTSKVCGINCDIKATCHDKPMKLKKQ